MVSRAPVDVMAAMMRVTDATDVVASMTDSVMAAAVIGAIVCKHMGF